MYQFNFIDQKNAKESRGWVVRRAQSYIESDRSGTITLASLDLTSTPNHSQMVSSASHRGTKLTETLDTFTWSSRGNPKLQAG